MGYRSNFHRNTIFRLVNSFDFSCYQFFTVIAICPSLKFRVATLSEKIPFVVTFTITLQMVLQLSIQRDQTYLHQMLRELGEVWNSCKMLAVRWVVLQSSLKPVKGRYTKEIHFAHVWFLQSF